VLYTSPPSQLGGRDEGGTAPSVPAGFRPLQAGSRAFGGAYKAGDAQSTSVAGYTAYWVAPSFVSGLLTVPARFDRTKMMKIVEVSEKRRYADRGRAWLEGLPDGSIHVLWTPSGAHHSTRIRLIDEPRTRVWELFERLAGLEGLPWQVDASWASATFEHLTAAEYAEWAQASVPNYDDSLWNPHGWHVIVAEFFDERRSIIMQLSKLQTWPEGRWIEGGAARRVSEAEQEALESAAPAALRLRLGGDAAVHWRLTPDAELVPLTASIRLPAA
jgi:hypothetical protein